MPYQEVPETYLTAIGRVIVCWSELEALLELILMLLAGMDATQDRSHILFPHISFLQKMHSLMAFLELESRTKTLDLDEAKKLFSELDRLNAIRNRTVHHMWYGDDKGDVGMFSVTSRGKLKMTLTPIPLQELEKTSMDIRRVMIELTAVASKVVSFKRGTAPGAVAKAISQNP